MHKYALKQTRTVLGRQIHGLLFGAACLLAPWSSQASEIASTSTAVSVPTLAQLSPSGNGSLDLDALKGRVVYLDFWASWCGPCRQSFPWMKEVQQRFADKGLVVVAVNLDKDRSLADSFIREFRPQFPVLYDKEGKLAQQYKITAMPYSMIIDREGKARYLHSGFSSEERQKLNSEIQQLLN
jgi:thiol-disulfide isomerase/thioredoxin